MRRLKQSIVYWCFAAHWSLERMIEICQELGIQSIELLPADLYAELEKHDLTCALATLDVSPQAPFEIGWSNPAHWERLQDVTRQAIDAAAAHNVQRVIAFTGPSDGIPLDQGRANCIGGLKTVVDYAERRGVTLCLEMLNSRANDGPMRGHPGYQGDDIEFCLDIVQAIDSPHVRLLFDVYHVQVMHGDIIQRLTQYAEWIGHIHTAGVPGRRELDNRQELNYDAILQTIADIGYDGFVGHEFIPTKDPLDGLKQAVQLGS